MSAVGVTALNTLFIGSIRIPCAMMALTGALLTGELARRFIRDSLGKVGFHESKLGKGIDAHMPIWAKNVLNLTSTLEYRELAATAIKTSILGIVGWELTSALFGKPHPMYNKVLTYLGPVRFSSDLHPAITWTMRQISNLRTAH